MEAKEGHTYVQWLMAILANLVIFTYGLQVGWMSPMTKILQSEHTPTGTPLSDGDVAWIASTFCLAAMVSTPFYAYAADRFGRKPVLIAIPFLQAITWIVKLFTASVPGLIAARLVCGLAAGGCFNIIPMYTKEIAQDDIRGRLGTLLFLFQNLGFLVMYAMGSYMDYRTLLWAVAGIPIVLMALLTKAPESPAYLMKIGKVEEVTATLAFLRGLDMNNKQLQLEVEGLKTEAVYHKSISNLTLIKIFRDKGYRRSFLIILAVITVQAGNGNFAILTYAANILESSGATISPELQTLSFPAVMLLGSFVSLLCVERLGRKLLSLVTHGATVIALGILATTILIQTLGGSTPSWIPAVTMVTSLFMYAAGISPVVYIVMNEIFNDQIRAKLIGVIVTYAWFISFVQLMGYSTVSATLGLHTTFFAFAGINLIGLVIVLIFMPETKGKSIEEIEKIMRS